MIIYDDVKKDIKIALYSNKTDNILEIVEDKLLDEQFNVVTYDDLNKLENAIIKNKVRILVINQDGLIDKINKLGKDICVILVVDKENGLKAKYGRTKVQNVVTIDELPIELMYSLRIVAQSEKIDYQKYKMELVSNLVESMTHKIQANLLTIGASLDVIKMVSEDEKITENLEKSEVIESLYDKNDVALSKANMLLELLAEAAAIENESVLRYEDIIELIQIILDEYFIDNSITLKNECKIKEGTYLCGPLNDIIFIICSLIKEFSIDGNKQVTLELEEDENNWYFKLTTQKEISSNDRIYKLTKFITYIKNVRSKVKDNIFTIKLSKIK